jgi:peptide/nickel transport system permease protein
LQWLPAIGYVSFTTSPAQWLRSIVLPVFALAIGPIGLFAKFTRQGMLEALSSEYVRSARANGISPRSIVFIHAFKTASLQVVTIAGLLTVGLLTGTVFVENVFSLPGLGSLLVDSSRAYDVPVVIAVSVVFTLIVIAVNIIVDLAYAVLSPKVRVT